MVLRAFWFPVYQTNQYQLGLRPQSSRFLYDRLFLPSELIGLGVCVCMFFKTSATLMSSKTPLVSSARTHAIDAAISSNSEKAAAVHCYLKSLRNEMGREREELLALLFSLEK
jgi:hypothetical protein